MYYDSLTTGVWHEPRYVIITATGETGIFTVAQPSQPVPAPARRR